MLDIDTKAQLKSYLERATTPIEIVASLDNSDVSSQMQSLLRDIAEASKLVTVSESRADNLRKPSFSINRPSENHGPRFCGLPMGHEFTSLILALLQIGGYPPKVEDDVLQQIRALDGDFDFEIYVSLSCHSCPDVVQALNLMAVQNPRIRATMIDGSLFQGEVKARQVMAVPTVFLNGTEFSQGRISLEEILSKIDTSGVAREAKKIDAKAAFDMLMVGGGPAGAAAAVYAARKGIRTGVVSQNFGGQTLDTLAIENYISVKETDGPKFALAIEQQVRSYDVDIMNMQRAKALILNTGLDKNLIEVQLESGATLRSRSVVISTGARWKNINVPGEREFKNKGVAYCPHCDGPLFKGKHVAVIGGGNSGVEVLVRKLHSLANVTVITNAQTTEITGDQKVNGLVYKDRTSQENHTVVLEGVFIQIGLVPNTDWLKGVIELSKHGEIIVDAKGQTSVPGVFAAGDATTVPFKQIIIAAGDGAKAALGAFDHLMRTSVTA
jgi:alkyl hydroperoxide reductase subunit F